MGGCGVLRCVGRNLSGRTEKNRGNCSDGGWNTSTDSTWHLTEHKSVRVNGRLQVYCKCGNSNLNVES